MIHEELRTETVELVVVLHSLEPIVRLHRRQPVLAGARRSMIRIVCQSIAKPYALER